MDLSSSQEPSGQDPQRLPQEAAGDRMAALSRLPLFISLRGERCLVADGSSAAAWKAELLSAAGASVLILAEEPSDEAIALAAAPPPSAEHGAIALERRSYLESDLDGIALAVGAFAEEAQAEAFLELAKSKGVIASLVDRADSSAVTFGSIINRSPLVISVNTDGVAPLFGQAVRARIEALLPQGLAGWAATAKSWRERVKSYLPGRPARRRFWQAFTNEALERPEGYGDGETWQRLLGQAEPQASESRRGRVTLVGSGPGDPEFLTLRALRALQSAEVILYDDLVHPAVLDLGRREARKLRVGKRGYGPSCKQSDINALLLELAEQGLNVVRLKGGDPMIFGRAGEELTAARAAGIPVEVVPGITAAQGAAARLGISLTHRDHARRLQYVTAHAKSGRLPQDIDWQALADPTVTTVVYMPKHTLAELVTTAVGMGLDPETPALAMANATRSDEFILAAPVAALPDRLTGQMPDGPMLVLVGQVFGELDAQTAAPALAAALLEH
ncbi:MAG: siroheme synthase CysG [Kiloniellales bacterium]